MRKYKQLSKKNKNTHKHKYNTHKFLYKIRGGSGKNVASSNNVSLKTLRELIQSKTPRRAIIIFNDLKIQCKIGAKKLLISYINGDTGNDYICIIIIYDFDTNVADIGNFFYDQPKTICIGLDKAINNTAYKKSHNIQKTYNKDLNKLLLKLIDVININLQMKSCKVFDESEITCNNIKISLSIKHYERGYGFYNEFGYLYINNQNAYDSDASENIKYANTVLQTLYDISHTTMTQLEINIKKEDISVDNNLYTSLENLLSLYKKIKIHDVGNNVKTLRQVMREILQFMCDPTNIEIINTLTIDEKKYIQSFVSNMFQFQKNILKLYYKFYIYNEKQIFSSELNTSDEDKNIPIFEMKPFEQPRITITYNTKVGDVEYIINIK